MERVVKMEAVSTGQLKEQQPYSAHVILDTLVNCVTL